MIAIPVGSRVYLAMGATDMRNYAAHTIMRSPPSTDLMMCLLSTA
jgi:hypothetical protein